MKSNFFNTILFALSLSAAVCCTNMEQSPSWSLGEGDYSIDLSAFCQGLETKAGKAGEDAYNENKLVYIDWFVFKSSSDEDAALISGRLTPSSPVTGSASLGTICLDNVYPSQSNSFYVYAVANLPGYSEHNAMPKTLAGLQAVPVNSAFNQQDFEAQESFVMRGGVDGITFTSSDRKSPKAVSIPLTRLAAKVSVDLNVVPAIDERETLADGSKRYVRTWYPDVENMEVYLSFANNHTSIEGTPVSYNNSFFTYYRTCFDPVVPSAQPSWDSGKWAITGTPFYTYPMTWDSDSPQAPFLKVILRWTAYDESQNGTVDPVSNDVYDEDNQVYTSTFRHQRNKPAAYMLDDNGDPVVSGTEVYKEFYYKIPLTNLDDTYGTLEANDWLEITADLSILGSTSDDLPVILSGRSYVTGWGVGTSTSGELRQANYLSPERYTYEVFAEDEITIPVISSHNLSSYKVKSATYNNYSTGTTTTSNLSTWNSSTKQLASPDWISFDENKSFTLHHHLITDFTDANLECSAITYVLTVTNEAGKESEDITIVQYPPLYIDAKSSNGYVFINGETNHYNINAAPWADRFKSQAAHPIYDDGDEAYTFTPTLAAGTDEYTDSRNVSVVFDTEDDGNKKKAVTNHRDIMLTAPAPYYIYKLDIGCVDGSGGVYGPYQAGSNNGVTYTADYKSFNQSSNLVWYGEARSLNIHFNDGALNARVQSITVYYHNSNLLGTIAHYENSSGATANTNMYLINVTDVSQMDFFIANTRSSTSIDFDSLTYGNLRQGGAAVADRKDPLVLSGYYPLNNIPYNDNAIAPRFLVASTYGGSYASGMRYESARERCASYQENGYPAGRWRLPTDAEIQFIVYLSARGKIPRLFNGIFWGSSGSRGIAIDVSNSDASVVNFVDKTDPANYPPVASIRCVYPLWYWGDEPVSTAMTTWDGWHN